ncbi:GtrA family protein [Lachnospiraceae bacterium]|nr:GtrA family protein [Lachnospiraceae bacterium]
MSLAKILKYIIITFMKNLLTPQKKEIILYIIFGILTTLVSWGTYALLVNLCSLSVLSSNTLSWICGVCFAFVTNKIWVFESHSWKLQTICKEGTTFVSSRIITGILEIFAVPLLSLAGFDNMFFEIAGKIGFSMKLFYTEGIYSKAAFAVIVIILNYIFSKILVFKNKNSQ